MSPETLYAVAAQVGPTTLLGFVLEARMTTVGGARAAVGFLRLVLWGGVIGATLSSMCAISSLAYPPTKGGEAVMVGIIMWGMLAGFTSLALVLLLSLSTIELTGLPQSVEKSRLKREGREAQRAEAKERRRAARGKKTDRTTDDDLLAEG